MLSGKIISNYFLHSTEWNKKLPTLGCWPDVFYGRLKFHLTKVSILWQQGEKTNQKCAQICITLLKIQNLLRRGFFLPPAYVVWGKVMFSVVSACRLGGLMWPLGIPSPGTCSVLFTWEPPPPHSNRLIQTYSPRSPYIYWQTDGWPSTERLSFFLFLLIKIFAYVMNVALLTAV